MMEGKLTYSGTLDELVVTAGKKGDYIKMKINGKIFNFFDMDYYNQHKELFKLGSTCEVIYYVSKYGENNQYSSNVANAIAFDKEIKQQTITGQENTVAQKSNSAEVEAMMLESMESAISISKAFEEQCELSPEDVRHIGISMFIEKCRRRL